MSGIGVVVQAEHLAEEAAEWLAQKCELVVCPSSHRRFRDVLAQASGLVVRTYTTVDEKLLEGAPNLRVVGRAGVGLDNIDVPACRARGVEVVHTPNATTQAVVEFVVGLLVDGLRHPVSVSEPVDQREWKRLRSRLRGERQMSQLVLGILGLGRIGRRLAEVARALGFQKVLYNDLVDIDPLHRFGALSVVC